MIRRRAPGHFGVVLALLSASYVLSGLFEGAGARVVVGVLYVLALLATWITARPDDRFRPVAFVVAGVGLVAVVVAGTLLSGKARTGVTSLVLAVVLGITVVRVVERVLRTATVDLSTIAGAISAYLLIGMLFASLFGVLDWTGPQPLFNQPDATDPGSLQYFSFTTLTTLGYGDITAASSAGRTLATFEALLGQVFLATLVASQVAAFQSTRQRIREERLGPDEAASGD